MIHPQRIITGWPQLRSIVEIEVKQLSMLEAILVIPMRSRAYGFFWGFALIRLIVGIAVAVVLIWLLLKLSKLVEAYTKKLK